MAKYKKIGYYNDSLDVQRYAYEQADKVVYAALSLHLGHFYKVDDEEIIDEEELKSRQAEYGQLNNGRYMVHFDAIPDEIFAATENYSTDCYIDIYERI